MTNDSSRDARAAELGVVFAPAQQSYLNQCARVGNLYLTSGHTSSIKGKLGSNLTVDEGRSAAAESVQRLLSSVHAAHGTLDGLRVVRLMACVNATAEFGEHAAVINGASDLVHAIFGPHDGYHARSALGFVSLPGGAAVEIEAVIEVLE